MLDRRLLLKSLAGGVLAAQSQPRLVAWMYMIYPLEQWLTDYERTLDAWEAGGVRGIVIGPLRFWEGTPTFDFTYARRGAQIQAFAPDASIYRRYGVDPPQNVRLDAAKERQLQGLLDAVARRKWEVMLFGPGHYGRRKAFEQDPFGALSLAAGVEDTLRALPQAAGVIIDGAGEHHYELAFHHGGELFEIRDHQRTIYVHLGFDVARMERGMRHLRERFHQLTPARVRFHRPGGMLAGLSLFDVNEDALYWLRMRVTFRIKWRTSVNIIWRTLQGMDQLAGLTEEARKVALDRFRLLQPTWRRQRESRSRPLRFRCARDVFGMWRALAFLKEEERNRGEPGRGR